MVILVRNAAPKPDISKRHDKNAVRCRLIIRTAENKHHAGFTVYGYAPDQLERAIRDLIDHDDTRGERTNNDATARRVSRRATP